MSDLEQSARRGFQFHLSTALWMVLAAAFFAILNARYIHSDPFYILGWPFKFYWYVRDTDPDPESEMVVAMIDLLIAATAVVFVAFVSESVIRRRRAKS